VPSRESPTSGTSPIRAGTERAGRRTGPGAVLALQRGAGNRAVGALLRKVDTSQKIAMVRFVIGTEIHSALARLAWAKTSGGRALDDAAIKELREVSLRGDETIDDDERMFIAALLDRLNAERLHFLFPHGFSNEGDEIELPVQRITAANRARVRDFGRSDVPRASRPAPGRKRDPDQAMLDMAGPHADTVRKALALADRSRVPHGDVQAAMLAAASDSTPSDRALAAAVYTVARSVGLPGAADLQAGKLKVDAVDAAVIGEHAAAVYQTAGSGRKGDTLYVRATFDVDDLDQQGTVVHELSHAADDKAVSRPTLGAAEQMELKAFRAQARFYLKRLQELFGDARDKAIEHLAEHAGPVRIYTMLMEANSLPTEEYDDAAQAIYAINVAAGALGTREWRIAEAASNRDLEPKVLQAIRKIERLRPGQTGQNDGLSGESVLDWKFR
jgi:hypothetical protein